MEMLEDLKVENTKKKIKRRIGKEEWVRTTINYSYDFCLFLIMLVLPLLQLFTQAFYDKDGAFIGVTNFSKYFTTPTLVQSLQNTVWVSGATTIIAVAIAFGLRICNCPYECFSESVYFSM